ncbi:MAG: hypothetical protein HQK60_19055 [Deltaproteobacteria bacterium]|nr:hypothetical protein [Deltaproteobacteria bacterium]
MQFLGATRFFKQQLDCDLKNNLERFLKIFFPNKKADGKVFKPIDILLYGYSETVIKSICGFRDAVVFELLKEYCANDSDKYGPENTFIFTPIHRFAVEKKASRFFRIFVCEGQPKNRTAYGGRLTFHDGITFTTSLADRGFSNIYLIPDAIAGTLLSQQVAQEEKDSQGKTKKDDMPRIDYVMVGANGFDNKYFRHSAGHAMVISLARNRDDIKSEQEKTENVHKDVTIVNEAVGSVQEQTESVHEKVNVDPEKNRVNPLIIWTVTTNKYEEEPDSERGTSNNSVEKSKPTPEQGTNPKSSGAEIEDRDGWRFLKRFKNEETRTNVFVSQDLNAKKQLRGSPVLFYNPREDRIPIEWVDVVIAEGNFKMKLPGEEKFTGKYIAENLCEPKKE